MDYKRMSVYQVWPRSFCDGNGDGIGDLEGIYSKLEYIKSLGVDCIWFSPLYPSPNADFGYDIADYKNIHKDYGTLAQFKKVLDRAHELDLKVIMDLVVNHSSDENKWFKDGINPDSKYHNYYIWRKGRGKNGKRPPNNWLSLIDGKAWEYNEQNGEYYLHVFTKKQPDLNMDNPQVRNEVKDIMRFWLNMGVDGFREDVITLISKKEGLPNGFPLPAATGMEHYFNGPNVKAYLKEFKEDVLDKYDCFVVGEAPMMKPKTALEYIKEGRGQTLEMMFHFQHMEADCFLMDFLHTSFNLKKMKKAFSAWQKKLDGKAWNALYIENHDHPRIINRYGSEKYREQSAKMLASMYILQKGTPFIYQGQEIGMTNIDLPADKFIDVFAKNNAAVFKKLHFPKKWIEKMVKLSCRDNARTPMQWDDSQNAGFTSGTPWFYVNPNYTEINVKKQEDDENSILNFYRNLLAFRKENDVVIDGKYKEYYKNSDKIYVYERVLEGTRLLTINSFTQKGVRFEAPKGYNLEEGELIFQNYNKTPIVDNGFVLRPYETRTYLFED